MWVSPYLLATLRSAKVRAAPSRDRDERGSLHFLLGQAGFIVSSISSVPSVGGSSTPGGAPPDAAKALEPACMHVRQRTVEVLEFVLSLVLWTLDKDFSVARKHLCCR